MGMDEDFRDNEISIYRYIDIPKYRHWDGSYGKDGRRWEWMRTFEISIYRDTEISILEWEEMGVMGRMGMGRMEMGYKKEETLGGFLFFMGWD